MDNSWRELHTALGASFETVNGLEVACDYGDSLAEYKALRETAGVLDLSFHGRLCLVGADRKRFLHGQVTNDVNRLQAGHGCYAAIVTAKGKLQSDVTISCLNSELLLDLEPGVAGSIAQRLEKYVIADDVQIIDVSSQYGLLSVQGPESARVVQNLDLPLPKDPFDCAQVDLPTIGELVVANRARTGSAGYDLFIPQTSLPSVLDRLTAAAKGIGGRIAGWRAFETTRIEAGIPRFGQDMDENNLAPEPGLDAQAISYSKGCYIGQEVIARIRTYGQVAKSLRGLILARELPRLPAKGEKLFAEDKEIGYLTSAAYSPAADANIALGYVRKEHNSLGAALKMRLEGLETAVIVASMPFTPVAQK